MAKGHKKKRQASSSSSSSSSSSASAAPPPHIVVARWASPSISIFPTHDDDDNNNNNHKMALIMDDAPPSPSLAEWLPASSKALTMKPLIIDLHTHSACSDGMLTPQQLVQKAVSSGVQVLALTDHDTMSGIPEALQEANKHKIRLIPGVEISAHVPSSMKSECQDPVHILGYYSSCGPMRCQELEKALAHIREGRYHRAKTIVSKLMSLKKPVEWARVIAFAGAGVAPGRVHIARALVEAGHVCNLREAFNKYLYDGGPAYAPGYEMAADDAVRLIRDTGGISSLAHPWSLKDPLSVVKRLKSAGLHAIEVYRGNGKASGFGDLAASYNLLKLGGSDFHGRGDPEEVKLGKVFLPLLTIHEFLEVSEPVWIDSLKGLLQHFANDTFEINSDKVVGLKYFTEDMTLKGDVSLKCALEGEQKKALLRLSPWLTEMERLAVKEAAIQLKLDVQQESEDGQIIYVVSREI